MIDVMMITFNEAVNLPHSLAALQGWTRQVFVVDSGSTDGSQAIAEGLGATVVHHDWPGYAKQKNWGLDHLPFESPWILMIDADEVVTPQVRTRLEEIAGRPVDEVAENGFFINRLTWFLGRPIRHAGYFPSWNLRFFKRASAGRYEERAVHEHFVLPEPLGYIREPMTHHDRRGLEHYVAKHNRYSTLEAATLFAEAQEHADGPPKDEAGHLSWQTRWRRWLKRRVLPRLPMPGLWRFAYMYFFKLGILDGWAGFQFCWFIGVYDYLVALKLRELRRLARGGDDAKHVAKTDVTNPAQGLAVAEGSADASFHDEMKPGPG